MVIKVYPYHSLPSFFNISRVTSVPRMYAVILTSRSSSCIFGSMLNSCASLSRHAASDSSSLIFGIFIVHFIYWQTLRLPLLPFP